MVSAEQAFLGTKGEGTWPFIAENHSIASANFYWSKETQVHPNSGEGVLSQKLWRVRDVIQLLLYKGAKDDPCVLASSRLETHSSKAVQCLTQIFAV